MSRLVPLIAASLVCACATPKTQKPVDDDDLDPPPVPTLTVRVVDDLGAPVVGTFVRVMECCHTSRSPCGRMPVDADGRVSLEVCPRESGIVHVTLTPDPRRYRVAPVREVQIKGNTAVTLSVTRHDKILRHLKPD